MGYDKIKMTKRRIKLIETYEDLDDSAILKEILYAQSAQLDKLEKIRANTSMLVWWLIAIPLILFLLAFLFGGFGAMML